MESSASQEPVVSHEKAEVEKEATDGEQPQEYKLESTEQTHNMETNAIKLEDDMERDHATSWSEAIASVLPETQETPAADVPPPETAAVGSLPLDPPVNVTMDETCPSIPADPDTIAVTGEDVTMAEGAVVAIMDQGPVEDVGLAEGEVMLTEDGGVITPVAAVAATDDSAPPPPQPVLHGDNGAVLLAGVGQEQQLAQQDAPPWGSNMEVAIVPEVKPKRTARNYRRKQCSATSLNVEGEEVRCKNNACAGEFCISHGGGPRCIFIIAPPAAPPPPQPEMANLDECAPLALPAPPQHTLEPGGEEGATGEVKGERVEVTGGAAELAVVALAQAAAGTAACVPCGEPPLVAVEGIRCTKSAVGATLYCKAHGGGKRCQVEGCGKASWGCANLCRGHGGGRRCQREDCGKAAEGSTPFCVAHGGGRRCLVEGCGKGVRRKSTYCAAHDRQFNQANGVQLAITAPPQMAAVVAQAPEPPSLLPEPPAAGAMTALLATAVSHHPAQDVNSHHDTLATTAVPSHHNTGAAPSTTDTSMQEAVVGDTAIVAATFTTNIATTATVTATAATTTTSSTSEEQKASADPSTPAPPVPLHFGSSAAEDGAKVEDAMLETTTPGTGASLPLDGTPGTGQEGATPKSRRSSRKWVKRGCEVEECPKTAIGRTRFCIAHGGGKRCQTLQCTRSAIGSTSHCKAHGGGKRCCVENCGKAVWASAKFCRTHGGGRRCQFPECGKAAEGATLHCIAHGGGSRCSVDGCTKVLRGGGVSMCKKHRLQLMPLPLDEKAMISC